MSIPLFSPNPGHLANLERALAAAGYSCARHASLASFAEATWTTEASVLVLRRLADLHGGRASGVSSSWDPQSLIVITDPCPENVRHLVTFPATGVLFLGEDFNRVAPLVRRLASRDCFSRWTAAVRRRPGLPPLLRRALTAVLEQAPSVAPVDPGENAALPRSVRALSGRLDCSEDYLGKSARGAGIDLPGFLKWNVALRALQVHLESGMTWEAVAWRLGFASASGLSEHLKHTLGLRPTAIAPTDLRAWMDEFERRFFPELLAD